MAQLAPGQAAQTFQVGERDGLGAVVFHVLYRLAQLVGMEYGVRLRGIPVGAAQAGNQNQKY